jgi:hypothetical protein
MFKERETPHEHDDDYDILFVSLAILAMCLLGGKEKNCEIVNDII